MNSRKRAGLTQKSVDLTDIRLSVRLACSAQLWRNGGSSLGCHAFFLSEYQDGAELTFTKAGAGGEKVVIRSGHEVNFFLFPFS